MEHLTQPSHSQSHTPDTARPTNPHPKKKSFQLYKKFMNLPEWQQMAIAGAVILLFIVTGGGVFAVMKNSSKEPQPSPTPKISNVTITTPAPTITPFEEEESTPTPKPSTTPSPKPSTTPTPKPSTSPSPTPDPTKTYVLNWSTGEITLNVAKEFVVSAILKYDGQVVKDQKNVNYTWTVADSSIADITPKAACTEGIQEPCPNDHATIKTKKEGNTTVTAKATWKDTGAFIDDVTIQIKVAGGSTPTPSPSPTPSPTASPTPTPSPTPGP